MSETEVKKRRGWDRVIKPRPPTKPKEPLKTITVLKVNKYILDKALYEGASFNLKDIIPKDIPLETICFDFKIEYGDKYNSDEYVLEIYSRVEEQQENPNYDKQFKAYQKNLAIYKQNFKAHREEMKEYKLWLKQEEMKELQARLEQAREFIKMHEEKK